MKDNGIMNNLFKDSLPLITFYVVLCYPDKYTKEAIFRHVIMVLISRFSFSRNLFTWTSNFDKIFRSIPIYDISQNILIIFESIKKRNQELYF